MLKKILLGVAILFGLMITCCILWLLSIMSAFGLFDKSYSPEELVDHFNESKQEIYELRSTYLNLVPSGKSVDIEFENNKQLSRLIICNVDSLSGEVVYPVLFTEWDLPIPSAKLDIALNLVGWSYETLSLIKSKLDKANCIQISTGEPTQIGFKRSGMEMYFFNVFEHSISDKLANRYDDSCNYTLINRQLALEHRGGAIGPDCFFNKAK